ncbi:MAG: HDOD domain-containing protein [Bdellovibrionales bacterium]|nr:HDOD domain-containing protein [Bdellovibrionales bacterium]
MTKTPRTVEQLINGIDEIASPPQTYSRISEALQDTECSVATIAEIISQDFALTSKLLKLANSAFFGFAQQIDTVTRAVTLLGIEQVRDLALATSVMEIFKDVPEELVSMQSFWKHSIGCGMISRLIAIHSQQREIERYFVNGILHDIGRLLLLCKFPENMADAIESSFKKSVSLAEAERKIFGYCHAEAGEALLKKWQLPTTLVIPVRYHHKPSSAAQHKSETRILHVSDILIHALELGSSGEKRIPMLSNASWGQMNISVDVLEPIMLQTEEEVELITGALLS